MTGSLLYTVRAHMKRRLYFKSDAIRTIFKQLKRIENDNVIDLLFKTAENLWCMSQKIYMIFFIERETCLYFEGDYFICGWWVT